MSFDLVIATNTANHVEQKHILKKKNDFHYNGLPFTVTDRQDYL